MSIVRSPRHHQHNGGSDRHGGHGVDGYLAQLADAIDLVQRETIDDAIDLLAAAATAGRRIYLIGNGGSAATASHMAVDLAKQAANSGATPVRAYCLSDNMPLLTAWANDVAYEQVFARQLECHLDENDVLVAISTSGRSPNVLRAAEVARARGSRVLALTGCDGGELAGLADVCIHAPSTDVGQQEVVHLAIDHAIASALAARLAAESLERIVPDETLAQATSLRADRSL